MSKSKFDCDGFQIVSRRFSRNKPTKLPHKSVQFKKEESAIDIKKALGRIHTAVEELQTSKYLEDFSRSVSTLLPSRKVEEIVCFGLGHIGECNISRYQLALLLCLRDVCGAQKVLAHDPIFYTSECDVLKMLGLEVIEQNNEGNYLISDVGTTVVYLPHCPKQLTNNFLWSNWGPNLENCILICNSFTSLIENQPSRLLSDSVPYFYNIFPHTVEVMLDNTFKYTDIFNNTSIHHFPKEKLGPLESDFWNKGEKPEYENAEEFITSLMVEKLYL